MNGPRGNPTSEKDTLAEIRRAFADYVASEGCSCCQDTKAHEEAAQRLGKLLKVPRYKDGSGYQFCNFSTKARSKV